MKHLNKKYYIFKKFEDRYSSTKLRKNLLLKLKNKNKL